MSRFVCIGDIESTGNKPETDRIVEVAFLVQDMDTREVKFSFEKRINPGCKIPAKITAIHGISNEDVATAPSFKDVAPLLSGVFDRLELIVGHNFQDFDAPMILHEFIRAGHVIKSFPPVFDTMKRARWATPDGKMPTLGELCWSTQVPYDKEKAHSALYDIGVNAEAFWRGIDLGYWELPLSPGTT